MKIIIDYPAYPPGLEALAKLGGVQADCLNHPEVEAPARVVDPERIADADALFGTFVPTNLADMRKLRWVQISSVGYNQLLGLGLPGRGVRATNCRGCLDVPIAEWNVAMMVNLARDLRQMIRNQEAGKWDRSAQFQCEIRGLTVGIWGYGGIGRETARLARQLGLRVHVLARHPIGPRADMYCAEGTGDPAGVLPHRVYSPAETVEFLGGLDFLILAMPLTAATKGLVGENELRALRPSAYLLNPARGPIVQEAALLRALENKWIAGAALDTHFKYPLPPEHPLWSHPNVILTPHISGAADNERFRERLWDLVAQNARRFLQGQPLLNELTPAELNAV